jgi:hypothetical protein
MSAGCCNRQPEQSELNVGDEVTKSEHDSTTRALADKPAKPSKPCPDLPVFPHAPPGGGPKRFRARFDCARGSTPPIHIGGLAISLQDFPQLAVDFKRSFDIVN